MRVYDVMIIVFAVALVATPLLILALLKKSWRRRAWAGLKASLALIVLSIGVAIATSPPQEVLQAEAAARLERTERDAEARRVAALAAEEARKKEAAEREARAEREKAERTAREAAEAEAKKVEAAATEAQRQRELAERLAPKPMVRDAIGCRTREANDRLGTIASSGDKEAFTKLALALVATSQCKILKQGTRLYLEDTAIFSGAMCGRPVGDVACFWLPIDVAKP